MRVLVVSLGDPPPPETDDALSAAGWEVSRCGGYAAAFDAITAGEADVVLVRAASTTPCPSSACPDDDEPLGTLLRLINARRIPAVLVSDASESIPPGANTLIDVAAPDAGAADLVARLSTVVRYHALVTRMEAELNNMQRLGKRLNRHFSQMDQEMRLAGRLQRDFLPRLTEPIPGVQFSTIYRPAMWVSGDIYDFCRVDEHHVAMFIADAVGHGMAASLLTMFIKQAVTPKRISGRGYHVQDPSEVLSQLNTALAEQTLPNCQFVTACYALLDTRTLRLRYARGGHPYPLRIAADGTRTELKSPGGLMGLFRGEEYPTAEVQLHAGDKLLLYTDGVELAFQASDASESDTHAYLRQFARLGHLPLVQMISGLQEQIDSQAGSLDPRDDITIVGMEIERAGA